MFLKKIKTRAGFTIIELMVSVGIIGILSGIGVAQYKKSIQDAYDAKLAFEYFQDQRFRHGECLKNYESGDKECRSTIELCGTTWAGYPANVGASVSEDEFGSASYNSYVQSEVRPFGANLNFFKAGSFPKKVCPNFDEKKCASGMALYEPSSAFRVCPQGWKLPTTAQLRSVIIPSGACNMSKIPATTKHPFRGVDGLNWSGNPGYQAASNTVSAMSFSNSTNSYYISSLSFEDIIPGERYGSSWKPPVAVYYGPTQNFLSYPANFIPYLPVVCVKDESI